MNLQGKKVTIMGLGLHGGGISTAKFLCNQGAKVTATDLRTSDQLASTLEKLKDYPITYILGEHRDEDFTSADIVIKNPGVPKSSPYLPLAKRVETDISLFLRLNRRPIIGITGSKGKSTTTALLGKVLSTQYPNTLVGGNIGKSPLEFVDQCLEPTEDPVILELSSWQLGDIADMGILKPQIAIITNILRDHQNSYHSMERYRDDKVSIARYMEKGSLLLVPQNDPWLQEIQTEATMQQVSFPTTLLPIGIPGKHNQLYATMALIVGAYFNLKEQDVIESMSQFTGVPDRLEPVGVHQGVEYINDTTATIPQATVAGIEALSDKPLHLITGGTDKELDFTGLADQYAGATSIHLLSGSGTDKLIEVLQQANIPYKGPFSSLEDTLRSAQAVAEDGSRVLFSPGGSSFEHFTHEFERGRAFKTLVRGLS